MHAPQALQVCRAKACSPEAITRWYINFEQFLEVNSLLDKPSLLWNCDESGFALCPKTSKVWPQLDTFGNLDYLRIFLWLLTCPDISLGISHLKDLYCNLQDGCQRQSCMVHGVVRSITTQPLLSPPCTMLQLLWVKSIAPCCMHFDNKLNMPSR